MGKGQVLDHRIGSREMVGRQEELAVLHACRRALGQSAGSIVLVEGEAGIGKTRLLEHFERAAREGRARIFVSSECLERAQQPFGPLRKLAAKLVPIASSRFDTNAARTVLQLTQDSLTQDGSAPAARIEKVELFEALIELLRDVCVKQSVIFSIEDIHWADASTLEFLVYAASRIATMRLLILATYRSDEAKTNQQLLDALGHMLRQRAVKSICLGALPDEEIRVLIGRASHGMPPPDNVSRNIIELSEGNPFFAEELARSALSSEYREGRATLPLSIRATILHRVATLSEDDRRKLSHAAVIGYRFDPALLARAMGVDVEAIASTLQRARDLEIVEDEIGGRLQCRFRHAVTQQTIYGELLAYDARRIHARVLATLESLGDRDAHLQELADHAWIAGDVEKTMRYNERAGDAAFAIGALSEAATCFQRAVGSARDEADEARIFERLTAVNEASGKLGEAIAATREALAIRIRREEWDDAGRLMGILVGDIANTTGERDMTAPEAFLLEHGTKLSRAARNRLLCFLARLSSAGNDFQSVDYYLSQVEDPDSLIPRVRQNYLISLLNRHSHFGKLSAWKSVAQECFDALSALDDRFLAAIGYGAVGYSGLCLQAAAEVDRALNFADEIVAKRNFKGLASYGAAIRAWHYYLTGDLVAARALMARALEDSEVFVAQQVLAIVGCPIALALDEPALATQSLRYIASQETETFTALDGAQMLASRGLWHVANDRLASACNDLRWALRSSSFESPGAILVIPVAARHLPIGELLPLLESAGDIATENVPGRANVAFVTAIVKQRIGDEAAAKRLAAEAAALFGELKWPLFEATALEVADEPARARIIYDRCGRFATGRQSEGEVSFSDALPLSGRERQIAECVTEGLSNTTIAERLAINNKTVEKHISSIFLKLKIRSRAELAAHVTRQHARREEP